MAEFTKEDLRVMNVIYEALLTGRDIVVKNDELKRIFGNITKEDVAQWNAAYLSAHGHDNKAFLDTLNSSSIKTYAGSGEVNTAMSVGSAADVYKEKSGTTLVFKTLSAGSKISLTENTNTVEIASTVPLSAPDYLYHIVAISAGTTYRGTLYAVNTIIERKTIGYTTISSSFSEDEITITSTDELWYETDLKASQDLSVITHNNENEIKVTPFSSWGVISIVVRRYA